MTQPSRLVGQRGSSQSRQPPSSSNTVETHLGSSSGAPRNESKPSGNNARPVSAYPVPSIVSDGVTTIATDSTPPGSLGLISSNDGHYSRENSDDISNSDWRYTATISGASTLRRAYVRHRAPKRRTLLRPTKAPPSPTEPVRRYRRRGMPSATKDRINLREPPPASAHAQIGSPTVGDPQAMAAAQQHPSAQAISAQQLALQQYQLQQQQQAAKSPQQATQAQLDHFRGRPAPSPLTNQEQLPQAQMARAHQLVLQQQQQSSDISLAKTHYTISQDHTKGEDARRSHLFASFGRARQKQTETQAAPVDQFGLNNNFSSLFDGGGMELANPLNSGDVLNDFDFDSFLHDQDGDNSAFNFTKAFPMGDEIGAD
ncbi:hypothetical protein F53441_12970 [Fusarium austroafricanum]|uniref:Uncharacterized protein n=1 Tax=Fusarium austroafricanum TaxID=2364996 RepID=A0A8H4JRJ0_9HYPO|nr:hypothetical protein F53441_12970 [Fusarium austroafricanum]